MATANIVILLIVLLVLLVILLLVVWLFARAAKKPSRPDEKTQPVIQKFYSDDLQRRAFIIRQNNGRYRVIYQSYSDTVINKIGETAGWTSLPDAPESDSLSGAVEIARRWTHGGN